MEDRYNISEISLEKRLKSNIILFLLGKFVSLFGTNIYNFAISFYVLELTGSGTSFAITMVLGIIPRVILGPFAGSIADRVDRKLLVVLNDILSGVLLIIIYFITLSKGLTLPFIYASTLFLTIFNTFFNIGFESAIPNIVDEGRLMKVNSFNQSIVSLSSILGPVIGGFMYGMLDINYFILFNGISFILSGISESFIDFNLTRVSDENNEEIGNTDKESNIMQDIKEGFIFIKSQNLLFSLMKYFIFINFFFTTINVSLPYIVVNEITLSSEYFGFIEGSFAVGSLIFSIVLSLRTEINSKYKLIITGLFILGILSITMGFPTSILTSMSDLFYLIYFALISFIIGSIIVFINIPLQVTFQKETPDKYRGRVFGVLGTMSMSIIPLGTIINGVLIDIFPSYIITMTGGVLIIMTVLAMIKNETLREL